MLFREEKDEEKKTRPSGESEFYADTMEAQKHRVDMDFMNLNKSAFANSMAGGINNDKGVFNTTALFNTNR